jgi:hypothetical protein
VLQPAETENALRRVGSKPAQEFKDTPLWGIKCSLPMLKAYRYAYILWQNMVWWSFGQQRHNITPVPLLREVKSWLVWCTLFAFTSVPPVPYVSISPRGQVEVGHVMVLHRWGTASQLRCKEVMRW